MNIIITDNTARISLQDCDWLCRKQCENGEPNCPLHGNQQPQEQAPQQQTTRQNSPFVENSDNALAAGGGILGIFLIAALVLVIFGREPDR